VPGVASDSSLDARALRAWLDAVRTECNTSGHLAIAMQTVGRVLSHAPPDPTGLWIHHGVAAILDDRDADDLRSGFRVQIYNSRGAHWVDPSGSVEHALANDFRLKATAVEATGFHRLGSAVRSIAEGYDREAEQIASRHGQDD